ncbi:MAG: chromate resistance protein [Pseudomonadota bacterium]|nr:chromate resistance protein [Pseudomonadota bacterium]
MISDPNVTSSWLLLIQSLPTQNTAARMRIWRATKAFGCGVLRDGVYVLPLSPAHREALEALAIETREAEGSAQVLEVPSKNDGEARVFTTLFDRTDDYARLMEEIRALKANVSKLDTSALRRALKTLRRSFEATSSIDFFPGAAQAQTARALDELEGAALAILSPDEPHAVAGSIERLDKNQYQGRAWATRKRPWVDRLASAWLIRRFIDPRGRIVWLDQPQDCPRDAIGFDFDGAVFTHRGARVTFEVLMASFGLDEDRGLARLASLVHYLDVGGLPVPEAAGLEALLTGARLSCKTDDGLLREAEKSFDYLCLAFSEESPVNNLSAGAESLPRKRTRR